MAQRNFETRVRDDHVTWRPTTTLAPRSHNLTLSLYLFLYAHTRHEPLLGLSNHPPTAYIPEPAMIAAPAKLIAAT